MNELRRGLIIVNTGPGKGKTTAAMGTAFRAVGNGMKVLMLQFIKGSWHYGELDAAKVFGDKFRTAILSPNTLCRFRASMAKLFG